MKSLIPILTFLIVFKSSDGMNKKGMHYEERKL
jgi:hypothetical protein